MVSHVCIGAEAGDPELLGSRKADQTIRVREAQSCEVPAGSHFVQR